MIRILAAAVLLVCAEAKAQVPVAAPIQAAALPSLADLIEGLTPSAAVISVAAPDEKREAVGSGFVLDPQGHVVTNAHVVEGASAIEVALADGTAIPAVVKGADAKTDLALLKLELPAGKAVRPAKFGDSDKLRAGDWVVSIGNPFGLGNSASAGIVSAKGRDIASGPYDSFIQTDAAINRGSSGGPLFNLAGEVVGVSTALFTTNGSSQGAGFAIPSNTVSRVVEQLRAGGAVERGSIGIRIQADASGRGVLVSSVAEGGPAQRAGIRPGDIVVGINGAELREPKAMAKIVADFEAGTVAAFDVLRGDMETRFIVPVEKGK